MWIEKIVGNLDDKKLYRQYRARVAALPGGYRETATALERYLTYFGPGDDGTMLVRMLTDLADLFEQAVADETPVRELVGAEPVEFAETFLSAYDGGSWITRERDRLVASIDKALT